MSLPHLISWLHWWFVPTRTRSPIPLFVLGVLVSDFGVLLLRWSHSSYPRLRGGRRLSYRDVANLFVMRMWSDGDLRGFCRFLEGCLFGIVVRFDNFLNWHSLELGLLLSLLSLDGIVVCEMLQVFWVDVGVVRLRFGRRMELFCVPDWVLSKVFVYGTYPRDEGRILFI